jgi:hypothetical protein
MKQLFRRFLELAHVLALELLPPLHPSSGSSIFFDFSRLEPLEGRGEALNRERFSGKFITKLASGTREGSNFDHMYSHNTPL